MHMSTAGNAHPDPVNAQVCAHLAVPAPRNNRPQPKFPRHNRLSLACAAFPAYSALKFSTGFARAARRLRVSTVPNATSTSPSPAPPNTHHDKLVR
jgi:hypothetical protein